MGALAKFVRNSASSGAVLVSYGQLLPSQHITATTKPGNSSGPLAPICCGRVGAWLCTHPPQKQQPCSNHALCTRVLACRLVAGRCCGRGRIATTALQRTPTLGMDLLVCTPSLGSNENVSAWLDTGNCNSKSNCTSLFGGGLDRVSVLGWFRGEGSANLVKARRGGSCFCAHAEQNRVRGTIRSTGTVQPRAAGPSRTFRKVALFILSALSSAGTSRSNFYHWRWTIREIKRTTQHSNTNRCPMEIVGG